MFAASNDRSLVATEGRFRGPGLSRPALEEGQGILREEEHDPSTRRESTFASVCEWFCERSYLDGDAVLEGG